MTRKNKKSKRGQNKQQSLKGGNIICVRGKGSLSSPSLTNSSGLFVATNYEIDTDMLGVWQQFANLYQKWRVNWIRFTHNPQQPTSVAGNVVMYINEDPYGSSAGGFNDAMNNRVSVATVHYRKQSLLWRPHQAQTWLWTKDVVAADDRDEFPGELNYCTANFASATTAGFITLEYELHFTDQCNSTTALLKHQNSLSLKLEERKKLKEQVESDRPQPPPISLIANEVSNNNRPKVVSTFDVEEVRDLLRVLMQQLSVDNG